MPASENDGMSLLRRLDDAVVPSLQRGARRFAHALGAPFRALRRWEGRLAHGRPVGFLWRHRQGLVLTVAVILFAGSYVHLQRYPELGAQAQDGGSTVAPTERPTGDDPALAGGAVSIGPAEGEAIGPYISQRREVLEDVPDGEERVAVVSFDEYLTPAEADESLSDELDAIVVQLRIPDPQMQPFEVEVEGSVEEAAADAIAEERDRIAREEAEFQELLESGTIEDEDFVAEFREQLERLRAVRNLLDTGTGTVFAVVVRGPGADLKELADDDRVRLVDPAPAETDPDASDFYGLLPDDEATASFGGLA